MFRNSHLALLMLRLRTCRAMQFSAQHFAYGMPLLCAPEIRLGILNQINGLRGEMPDGLDKPPAVP